MKKLLWTIFILTIIVNSSCSKKFCQKNYPCPPDSIRIENTVTVDSLWLLMPADTEFVQVPIDCPDQQIIVKDGKTLTKIIIKDRIITVARTTEKDSVLILTLKEKLAYFERIVKEQPVKYKNRWYFKPVLIGFISLLVFIIIRFRGTLKNVFKMLKGFFGFS